MKTLQCKNCGSTDLIITPGGVVICRACDSRFIADNPEALAEESEATILYGLARNAREAGIRDEMKRLYSRIANLDSHKFDWEPMFYIALASDEDEADFDLSRFRGYTPKALNNILYILNNGGMSEQERDGILSEMALALSSAYKKIAGLTTKNYLDLTGNGDAKSRFRPKMIEVEIALANALFNFGNKISNISPSLSESKTSPAVILWRSGVDILTDTASLGLKKDEQKRIDSLVEEYKKKVNKVDPSFNPTTINPLLDLNGSLAIIFCRQPLSSFRSKG